MVQERVVRVWADLKLVCRFFSIREDMKNDLRGTLQRVADMGYDCVELKNYFDYTAEELKSACLEAGLEPFGVHHGYSFFLDEPKETVDFLKTVGAKYVAIPHIPPDYWKKYEETIADIKKVGTYLKAEGIQLLYHNHDFEFFMEQDGTCLLDALYRDVPSELLQPELDVCWVHYAGKDPVSYIKKYGEVHEVLHIKDFECTNLPAGPIYEMPEGDRQKRDKKADGFEFRPIGYGRQDMEAILAAAEPTKIKYLVVEQDSSPSGSVLEDFEKSIQYLRSLGY